MKTNILSLAIFTILTFALSTVTQAQNGATNFDFHTTFDWTGYAFYNDCTGEDVVLSGIEHDHYWGTFTPSGKVRFSFHGNLQGITGVGVISGNSYNVVGAGNQSFNLNKGETFNWSYHVAFVSQGNSSNTKWIQTIHFTANPNGTITVDRDSGFNIICQ